MRSQPEAGRANAGTPPPEHDTDWRDRQDLAPMDGFKPESWTWANLWAVRWPQNFIIKFNILRWTVVELRGIEPLTSSLRTRRSTN